MKLNNIFVLAFILSAGWHVFWGLFFDLSLEDKQIIPGKEIVPVYYMSKSQITKDRKAQAAGIASSILPSASLPQTDIMRPPLPEKNLPQTEREMLTRRAKEMAEYKPEISLKKDFEPAINRKTPDWVLPERTSKEKENPIKWEAIKREAIQSYYPELPQWAEEIGLTSAVTVQFTVSAGGEVKEIKTEKSSGDARLDLLAASYLRRWKFLPSDKEAKGTITINFQKPK